MGRGWKAHAFVNTRSRFTTLSRSRLRVQRSRLSRKRLRFAASRRMRCKHGGAAASTETGRGPPPSRLPYRSPLRTAGASKASVCAVRSECNFVPDSVLVSIPCSFPVPCSLSCVVFKLRVKCRSEMAGKGATNKSTQVNKSTPPRLTCPARFRLRRPVCLILFRARF